MDAPCRPGGKAVAWNTNGFPLRERGKRMHGKCGIETFATWARAEVK